MADDVPLFHFLFSPQIKPTNHQGDMVTNKKISGENPKSLLNWSIFLVMYLLAITAVMLLRAVAIAAAIARATVVRVRLVAQAITGTGNKLEGDWGEIVALGAEISP